MPFQYFHHLYKMLHQLYNPILLSLLPKYLIVLDHLNNKFEIKVNFYLIHFIKTFNL